MAVTSSINSHTFNMGDTITINIKGLDSTKGYWIMCMYNYDSSFDEYTLAQQQNFLFGGYNAQTGATERTFNTTINQNLYNKNIHSWTVFYFKYPNGFSNYNDFRNGTVLSDYAYKSEIYNVNIYNGKKLSGIVDWLKNWFYGKDEVYDTGWTSLNYVTNMKDYSNDQPVRIRRIGKVVHIEGAFTSTLTSGSTFPLKQAICNENGISTYSDSYNLTVGTLDEQFRPSNNIYTVQQGSGINKYHLSITSQGKIRMNKYGSSSDVDPQSNPWLNINVTYMVD